MNKRKFIGTGVSLAALTVFAGCTTTGGSAGDPAARREAIDAAVDSALSRLYREALGIAGDCRLCTWRTGLPIGGFCRLHRRWIAWPGRIA